MIEQIAYIKPEIALFLTTCAVMIVGLSKSVEWRRTCVWWCVLGLVIAFGFAINTEPNPNSLFPEWIPFVKATVAGVGLLMLLVVVGTVDRDLEARVAAGKAVYSSLYATRAEFYAFFMFSLTGLMLVASADDLIWLFLALELTSLPTYMMVTISTRGNRSQEAGVKYFFLGALGAAIFLYGFALLYGATGTTDIAEIAAVFASDGISTLGIAGLLLAVLGVSFKIAAVPMHFYTPDVYQGAASPVSAFLAFVPKTAGFLAILLLTGMAGWHFGAHGDDLPRALHVMLWVVAAVTMTVGNVLALLQNSVKRVLAYSSIAHSGYMLVGVIAGPGEVGGPFWRSGVAAVLFYLMAYGVMNLGAFAALACLEGRNGREADSFDDIRGLCARSPLVGWSMVVSALSLLGMPPLLGFLGKFGLFTSGVSSGELPLVIILGVNSAIAAFYYLRIVATAALDKGEAGEGMTLAPIRARRLAAMLSACGAVGLIVAGQPLMRASLRASDYEGPVAPTSAGHDSDEGASQPETPIASNDHD
ncbi:MAG: NADH-quinone oxidoreductase subunit N [Phycisphaerales bacterium]